MTPPKIAGPTSIRPKQSTPEIRPKQTQVDRQVEQIVSLMGLSSSAMLYGMSNVMVNSALAPKCRATFCCFQRYENNNNIEIILHPFLAHREPRCSW